MRLELALALTRRTNRTMVTIDGIATAAAKSVVEIEPPWLAGWDERANTPTSAVPVALMGLSLIHI